MKQQRLVNALLFVLLTTICKCAVLTNYVIGNPTNLTWMKSDITVDTFDVVLFYGQDFQNSWTLGRNVLNNGYYIVEIPLNDTFTQFSIPNYSPGQFRAVYSNSTTTLYFNLTSNISILQAVVTSPSIISGQVTYPGESIEFFIKVATAVYNQNNQFSAQFVTLTGNSSMVNCNLLIESLGRNSSAPSRAPTPGQPTSSPTISPTTVPANFLYAASIFSPRSPRKLLADNDYVTIKVNVTVPSIDECSAGGPYLLRIGVGNGNQYYTINAFNNRNDLIYSFLNYNPSNLYLNVTVNDKAQTNKLNNFSTIVHDIAKYDDIKLNFHIDDAISHQPYYVVLSDESFFERYILACQSQPLSAFSSFGWKTVNTDSSKPGNLTGGEIYNLQIYWDVTGNWSDMSHYQLNFPYAIQFYISPDVMHSPVKIVSEKSYQLGNNPLITFQTSFNLTTPLYAYFEQCENKINSDDELIINCTTYSQQNTSFTYDTYNKSVSIQLPGSLKSSQDNKNLTTFLHVCADNCANSEPICGNITVNITAASSSKNNNLPAGAIVGIVCAGVLVLGLAAWWICMKRPKEETYQKMDD